MTCTPSPPLLCCSYSVFVNSNPALYSISVFFQMQTFRKRHQTRRNNANLSRMQRGVPDTEENRKEVHARLMRDLVTPHSTLPRNALAPRPVSPLQGVGDSSDDGWPSENAPSIERPPCVHDPTCDSFETQVLEGKWLDEGAEKVPPSPSLSFSGSSTAESEKTQPMTPGASSSSCDNAGGSYHLPLEENFDVKTSGPQAASPPVRNLTYGFFSESESVSYVENAPQPEAQVLCLPPKALVEKNLWTMRPCPDEVLIRSTMFRGSCKHKRCDCYITFTADVTASGLRPLSNKVQVKVAMRAREFHENASLDKMRVHTCTQRVGNLLLREEVACACGKTDGIHDARCTCVLRSCYVSVKGFSTPLDVCIPSETFDTLPMTSVEDGCN